MSIRFDMIYVIVPFVVVVGGARFASLLLDKIITLTRLRLRRWTIMVIVSGILLL